MDVEKTIAVNYDKKSGRLSFTNGIIKREFSTSGGFRTIAFAYAPCPANLVDAGGSSSEVVIRLNGKRYCVGGKISPFEFRGYSQSKTSDGAVVLHVWLNGNLGGKGRGILMGIHYCLRVGASYLAKWVTVRRKGKNAVVLTEMTPEDLSMPVLPGVLRLVQSANPTSAV